MITLRNSAITALLFVSIFAVSVVGQQRVAVPTPLPTPVSDDDTVVKVSTTLIQMDVTVTDRKGRIIRDLKPEEIEIYENGKKQAISNFSFVSVEKPIGNNERTAKDDNAAAPLPPVAVRPENIRRTFALVVDDLSLSFESVYQVRRTLKKYLDENMQDGDLVAIIRTGAGIGALQQFTSDKRMLYAAIERVKWNPMGRGGIGAFAPIEPTPLQIQAAGGDDSITEEDLEDERNAMNSFDDFRSGTFATGTLGALRYIVEGMRELPGRKSVVLFSDGFRLLERDRQGFSGRGSVMDFMDRLIETANRSSVVFYSIDARGLQYTGFTAADNISDTSAAAMSRSMSERSSELFETQAGLQYLSKETGGFAVINNNNLIGGMRRVVEDQSYYLVAYTPDEESFDPQKRRFNKLEIKVKRPDTLVRYRSGFFNIDDKEFDQRPKTEMTPNQQVQNALTSPFAVNDITLTLNSFYGNDVKGGNYVRSLLHVDAGSLKFVDSANGKRKAEIAVLAVSYGDNGVVVDHTTNAYTIEADNDSYKRLIDKGFVYNFIFPVKKPGAYQYRVVLRDQLAARVGSASQYIEVPTFKRGRVRLSGMILQQYSVKDWNAGKSSETSAVLNDTALRRFDPDSVLQFAYEIYNAKLDAAKQPNLTTKIRIFRDRELVLDGTDKPLDLSGQADMQRLKVTGAIGLNKDMTPGDYILQVVVTDNLAKQKQRITTHYITFEVADRVSQN